ncbi:hypothetical protein LPJ61_000182 [Coemansia biformis]|uniref:Uncharacterized protein n=1 Tax=Coemansia biformis TaxID=1286918 RepID=A0A9W7YJ81_9FUNG|nr:hypothetical protein LPJ61_000182 [Coemansia biformis]
MDDVDAEFDRARQQSQNRVRSAFEAIFQKYGDIDEDDDIIDLQTGRLLVDNGRMRSLGVIHLGDLLRKSESSGSPSKRRGHRQPLSPIRDAVTERDGTLSPELLSNDQLQQIGHLGRHGGVYRGGAVVHGRPRGLPRATSSDSDSQPLDYDSSDSVGTGEGGPLDAYFTTSIEQYLEKLRQQLAGPVAGSSTGTNADSESGKDGATWPGLERQPDDTGYVSESPSQASVHNTENQDPLDTRIMLESLDGRYAHSGHGFEGHAAAEQQSIDRRYSYQTSVYENDGEEFSEEEPIEAFESYWTHAALDTRPVAFGYNHHNHAASAAYQGATQYSRPPRPYRYSPAGSVVAPPAVSTPAIHKPQPVAPRAFFGRDGHAAASGREVMHATDFYGAYDSGSPRWAGDEGDDNASIHSGESLHEAPLDHPYAHASKHTAPADLGGIAQGMRPAFYDLQMASSAPGYDMYYAQ